MEKLRKYQLRNINRTRKTKATIKKPRKYKKKTIRERIAYAPEHLFDRVDEGKNPLCRYPFCTNNTKNGLRFCSLNCRKNFTDYHQKNFIWHNVRYKIFKRDNFTCQICKAEKFIRGLECDHIKPVDLLTYYGYKTLNLKAFEEYIYNEENLRTLCIKCHKNVTGSYLSDRKSIKSKLSKK